MPGEDDAFVAEFVSGLLLRFERVLDQQGLPGVDAALPALTDELVETLDALCDTFGISTEDIEALHDPEEWEEYEEAANQPWANAA